MSSGIVHERWNRRVAIMAGAAVGIAGPNLLSIIEVSTLTSLTIWAWGMMLSPDLDLSENKWGCRAKHRWGLLSGYWVPYGKMFKHRGMSHWIAIGTGTRLLYGLWPLLWWASDTGHWDVVVFVFLCGCVSDAVHLVLDTFN